MAKDRPATHAAGDARSAPKQRGAVGPLGTDAKTPSREADSASQGPLYTLHDKETGEVFLMQNGRLVVTPQQARANRWALKSVVNKLLPESRTAACMRLRAPIQGQTLGDIQIMKGIHKKAFYQGLMVCARVWHCPVCAAKISERRRLELKDALAAAEQQLMRIHFVTLTIPHGIGDDIKELNGKLSVALGKLSSGRASIKNQMREMCPQFEQYGYIRAFEVTHGRNGFHPHYHIIVFTSAGMDSGMVQTIYSRAWKRACFLAELPEPSAEHGVTVQDGRKAAQYASKWGLEDEMTKAHMKQTRRKGATPWGLLRAVLDGDDPEYPPERAASLFRVYAEAFAGRRQLYWSNGLRKLLQISKELTDEELAGKAEDERAVPLATLTTIQWRAIRRLKQEAHILTVAEVDPHILDIAIHWLVVRAAGLVEPDGAPSGGVSLDKAKSAPPPSVMPRMEDD